MMLPPPPPLWAPDYSVAGGGMPAMARPPSDHGVRPPSAVASPPEALCASISSACRRPETISQGSSRPASATSVSGDPGLQHAPGHALSSAAGFVHLVQCSNGAAAARRPLWLPKHGRLLSCARPPPRQLRHHQLHAAALGRGHPGSRPSSQGAHSSMPSSRPSSQSAHSSMLGGGGFGGRSRADSRTIRRDALRPLHAALPSAAAARSGGHGGPHQGRDSGPMVHHGPMSHMQHGPGGGGWGRPGRLRRQRGAPSERPSGMGKRGWRLVDGFARLAW